MDLSTASFNNGCPPCNNNCPGTPIWSYLVPVLSLILGFILEYLRENNKKIFNFCHERLRGCSSKSNFRPTESSTTTSGDMVDGSSPEIDCHFTWDFLKDLREEQKQKFKEKSPVVLKHEAPSWKWGVLNFLGYLYYIEGNVKEAKKNFKKVLKENKNNLLALRNLSYLFWEKTINNCESQKISERLEKLENNKNDLATQEAEAEAKIEKALVYILLNFDIYDESTVNEVKTLLKEANNGPFQNFGWKYIHGFYLRHIDELVDGDEDFREAETILISLIDCIEHNWDKSLVDFGEQSNKILHGRAWAMLGALLSNKEGRNLSSNSRYSTFTPLECFAISLLLCGPDEIVIHEMSHAYKRIPSCQNVLEVILNISKDTEGFRTDSTVLHFLGCIQLDIYRDLKANHFLENARENLHKAYAHRKFYASALKLAELYYKEKNNVTEALKWCKTAKNSTGGANKEAKKDINSLEEEIWSEEEKSSPLTPNQLESNL